MNNERATGNAEPGTMNSERATGNAKRGTGNDERTTKKSERPLLGIRFLINKRGILKFKEDRPASLREYHLEERQEHHRRDHLPVHREDT